MGIPRTTSAYMSPSPLLFDVRDGVGVLAD